MKMFNTLALGLIATSAGLELDFDAVDLSNTTTQGYRKHEIGSAKSCACGEAIGEITIAADHGPVHIHTLFDHGLDTVIMPVISQHVLDNRDDDYRSVAMPAS